MLGQCGVLQAMTSASAACNQASGPCLGCLHSPGTSVLPSYLPGLRLELNALDNTLFTFCLWETSLKKGFSLGFCGDEISCSAVANRTSYSW